MRQNARWIDGLFRIVVRILIICMVLSVRTDAFASVFSMARSQDTAYDQKLAEITDPVVYGIPEEKRHLLTADELLNAKTEAVRRLEKDGVSVMFSRCPDEMEQIAWERILDVDPEIDLTTVTEKQLQEAVTYLDLTLTDAVPIMERSWYDYALSTANTGISYAKKCISGYMFTVSCDGQYLALIQVKYLENGKFYCQYQDLPNNYRGLYLAACEEIEDEKSYPILLTDPKLHQAVAFLVPGSRNGIVFVKNYVSSSSKDEILKAPFEDFQTAAITWNRDTLSMLVAADGSIKSDVHLSYNNLESYVRSTLRLANKERLLRAACVLISMIVVIVMAVLIFYRVQVRFLDADDPRRQVKNFFSLFIPKNRSALTPRSGSGGNSRIV